MKNIFIVFDFDGTLVDTQKHHAQIESDLLAKYGVVVTPEYITQTYAGRTPREWISELLAERTISVNNEMLELFEVEKNQRIIDLARDGTIGLLPGVKNILTILKNNNIPVGIASGSSVYALNILIGLFQLGIEHYTSADEVEHKKPAPDVFNKTFDKMGAPTDCKRIVIGDGISDVLGGKAAGAKTIYVGISPQKAKVEGADMCIGSLADVTIQDIYTLSI